MDNMLTLPIARSSTPRMTAADTEVARNELVVGLINRSGGFDDAFIASLGPIMSVARNLVAHYDLVALVEEQEQEYARAEERFRMFMDASQLVAYLSDSERRVGWISEGFREKFGIDPADVVGRLEEELLPASLMARVRAIDEEVLETG
ncbi:hypothetical protein PPSIR1_25046, partial [Plesiocystis pacifica SIR-1]